MSTARDRDLGRWEQGGLSMSELVALHGRDGAAGLVALHRHMSALGMASVGDPDSVWRVIRERLPDLAGPRRTASLRRRLTRPLAIAAAAILIAGTAYAGPLDAVQRYLTSFWHRVQAVLDVDVAGNAPADADRPSQGGGQGDRPAGSVDDAELKDRDEDDASEDDQPGETSENDGGADDDEAEGDDGNGFDDDGEGTGDDDGGEPEDDEGDEPDDDEGDEPNDDGDEPNDDGDEPEDDGNEPEDDGNEPEGDDEGD